MRTFLPWLGFFCCVIAAIYWGFSCGIANRGVGHFNLGVVFFPRLSFATPRVVDGGLVQAVVTPSAPSYPVCDDGLQGESFTVFSVAFGGFPFLLRFTYYPYTRTLAFFSYAVQCNSIRNQCRTWAGEEGVPLLLAY